MIDQRIDYMVDGRYVCTRNCINTAVLISVKYRAIDKGQLISKCLFGAIVSTKKPTKFRTMEISALASKKRSNQKNKGTLLY